MLTTPYVSVIITTYNRVDYLVEAIDSVLAQTYTDYELLVADDGSTDNTKERVAAYGAQLRYLPLPHRGRPEDARNAAIPVAQGQLIAFLDDDDRWRADKLTLQVAAFANDPTLGMVYSDVQFIQADGSLSAPVLQAEKKQSAHVFERLLADCFIHPSSVTIHRRIFEQLGLFTARFFSQADYHFWLRAAHMAPVRCLPEPLTHIRRHPGGVSQTRNLRHYQCAIEVLADIQNTLPLTSEQRRIVRHTMATWHTHVGLLLHAAEPKTARQHFLRSLRLNPLQRRAWLALLGSP